MKTPAALSIAATILLTLACAGEDPAGDSPAPSSDPPTLEEIGNASIHIDGETVQLRDGVYERKAPAGDEQAGLTERREVRLQDVLLTGDLDEDGTPEAVVFATDWTGGTGTYWSLIVMDRRDEGVVQSAAASIGDRVQVRDARIDGRRIELDVVRAGEGDGLCCPGEMATMAWVFDNDTLLAVDSGVEPVRRSLAVLAGAEWVLTHFGDEALPDEAPEITLSIADGEARGFSGCNSYRGTANEDAERPGGLSFGPVMGTRKACAPEVMEIEHRYLERLGAVEGYSFGFHQLRMLVIREDGARSELVFTLRLSRPPRPH